MKDPDQILLEGRERRARQKRLQDAVDDLQQTTERCLFRGFFFLLMVWVLVWWLSSRHAVSDPMLKRDMMDFILHCALIGYLFKSSLSDLLINKKDAALRDLLEKELEKEKLAEVQRYDAPDTAPGSDPDPAGVAGG